MANHTREKPAGWALEEELTPTQATNLDTKIAQSVNGDEGGGYAGDQVWTGQHNFEAQGICMRYDTTSLVTAGTYQVGADNADTFQLANNPAGNVTAEIKKTDPVPIAGCRMRFHRPGITHSFSYTLKNGAGGPTIILLDSGSLIPAYVELIWDGSDWRLHNWAGDTAKLQFLNP